MSAAAATVGASATAKKAPKSSSWKNLTGLFPYLARYRGATALGMFALVVASAYGTKRNPAGYRSSHRYLSREAPARLNEARRDSC